MDPVEERRSREEHEGALAGNDVHAVGHAEVDRVGVHRARTATGATIILVACYKGYYTQHGAEGVSKATNQTVVLSAVLILAWDYVLTSFFM